MPVSVLSHLCNAECNVLIRPMSNDSSELSGKLLIAMPGMGDPRFDKSVVFMCAHSPEGSMGLIVNKPAQGVKMDDLLKQLKIPRGTGSRELGVHYGGPVEHGRGFVLHSAEYGSAEGTQQVDTGIAMTATLDVLEDISAGHGPLQALLGLGYAGWGPGQLEDGLGQNGWLTTEAIDEIILAADNATKWERALKSMGIDAISLSATAGRA